jgi:hypothetical protein
VFPPEPMPGAQSVSFREKMFRMVKKVRGVLHDRPIHPGSPEPVR